MTAVLTERQVDVVVATAEAVRPLQVPRRWLLVRLSVVVDGRLLAIREEGARRAAAALAEVIRPSPGMVTFAVQGHEEAAVTLRSMRDQRAAGSGRVAASGHLVDLPDDDAVDAAVEQLAAAPHGVLVIATVGVDGHLFAARWS